MPRQFDPEIITYLIWSNEHGRWWRPNKAGYTSRISAAGRYRQDEACAIVDDANRHLPNGAEPREVMVLSPECNGAVLDTPEAS
jgi:hypothetical protein